MRYVTLAFLFFGAALAIVLLRGEQQNPATWTKEELALKLAELDYRSEWVEPSRYDGSYTQGLYLARRNDPRSWEEIVFRRPRRDADKLWRGLVVVSRDLLNPGEASGLPGPGEMRIGELLFFGDPEELERIAAHLQPSP
jgi:hypothetical protein